MTARTAGRTAIVSRISGRHEPISVVIALSACGRFSVMTATRPPLVYSTSTGWAGSSASDGGGPKSSAFQRSVCAGLVALFSAFPVQPLRLDELELPLGVGADEDEDDA